MRVIPPSLQAKLDSGATTLCRCWRIRRKDGREFCFTDHDADLTFGGSSFLASSGLDARAVQATAGMAVDNTQVVGALSADGITEEDVAAGRYAAAKVEHWLVDWVEPEDRLLMFVGTIGELRRVDGKFEAELRGLTESLNVPVGRIISSQCDRSLGDAKCRFDLNTPGYAVETEVISVVEPDVLLVALDAEFRQNWFMGGAATWLSGRNSGETGWISSDLIEAAYRRRLTLWKRPGFACAPGDRLKIFAGCDKSAETCRIKFDNFLNFRGFPDVPGDDWVTAYPRQGEVHDGSSRR